MALLSSSLFASSPSSNVCSDSVDWTFGSECGVDRITDVRGFGTGLGAILDLAAEFGRLFDEEEVLRRWGLDGGNNGCGFDVGGGGINGVGRSRF